VSPYLGLRVGVPGCARRAAAAAFVPPNSSAVVADYRLFDADTGTQATWENYVSPGTGDLTQSTAGFRPTTTGALHPSGTGYGLLFDTTDDTMTGGVTVTLGYRAIAIAMKATSVGGKTVRPGGGTSGQRFAFRINSGGGNADDWIYVSSANGTVGPDLEAPATTAYHYAMAVEAWNGSTGTADIYFDGSLIFDDVAIAGTADQTITIPVSTGGVTVYKMIVWESASPITFTAGDLTSLWGYLDAS